MNRVKVTGHRRTRRGKNARRSWLVLIILLASIALWINDQDLTNLVPAAPSAQESGPTTPADTSTSQRPESQVGGYEVYRDCKLLDHPSNDGDSFLVGLADGREKVFRLYFADAPESAFRRYRSGETNFDRIRSQARDMGGITPEQAVQIGKKAKIFTLKLLKRKPFTIYTKWDSPFQDQRFHAFVEVESQGKSRWLHELLIEKNLARILTKPADLPDGTDAKQQLEKLRQIRARN